ncbi:restriction endonuclease subunit S [Streptomyces sp. CC216C]|nr:restriction endonuclease subunit S [Streptomyces sp. CC216C]
MVRADTRTGGREAAGGVIEGGGALAVGKPATATARGFSWVKLTDVARLESGHTPSRRQDSYWNGGIPWVGIRDATGNHGRVITETAQNISQAGLENSSARLLPAGTVCLSRTASVGYVVVMGTSMATSQDFVNWVCGPGISSSYLRYVLVAEQQTVRRFSQGSTHQTVYYPEVKAFHVCLPGRGEQQAIADVLGALDDKIALNESICATELDLGDALHQVTVEQGSATQRGTLGQLMAEGSLHFGDGYRTKKAEHGTPGLPILRVAEVGDGMISPSFGDHVREEFRSAMGQKTSRSGDVVLTTKGTVGRVAIISAHDAEFVYSPQVCFFRPLGDAPISSAYLFHWLRGQEFWYQAAGMKGQTDMADYLSLSDIRSLKISLPEESALSAFDRQCAPLHARAEAARRENRTLADLRDTLLPQLITGKLRVKDATRVVEEAV